MSAPPPSLGHVLRELRTRAGLTLREMSARVGIPMSTLAKVEQDRLTLTYDKLQQISGAMNITLSDLFHRPADTAAGSITARRSITDLTHAVTFTSPNDKAEQIFLCGDLSRKKMLPIITRHTCRSLDAFGPLLRHAGEEFTYVISGTIEVHTEFYAPATLAAGQGIYLDSTMGHAYILAPGCDEAVTLCLCTSVEPADGATPPAEPRPRRGRPRKSHP